jgi:hypothetical protein
MEKKRMGFEGLAFRPLSSFWTEARGRLSGYRGGEMGGVMKVAPQEPALLMLAAGDP